MAKWYDPLTERWYTMPAAPVIERPKPNAADILSDRTRRSLRIAAHAHIWQAIEATATATQMTTPCPDGLGSAASES